MSEKIEVAVIATKGDSNFNPEETGPLHQPGRIPTQEEIVARVAWLKGKDFFGFESGDLLVRLDWDRAKPFLKADASQEVWEKEFKTWSRDDVIKEMRDYMTFAWEKANDKRGISASRTISHYMAWTFLAGDTDLTAELSKGYEFYGKELLLKICDKYGWTDLKALDDGVRENE